MIMAERSKWILVGSSCSGLLWEDTSYHWLGLQEWAEWFSLVGVKHSHFYHKCTYGGVHFHDRKHQSWGLSAPPNSSGIFLILLAPCLHFVWLSPPAILLCTYLINWNTFVKNAVKIPWNTWFSASHMRETVKESIPSCTRERDNLIVMMVVMHDQYWHVCLHRTLPSNTWILVSWNWILLERSN